jgi:hypothetical protein
MQKIPIPNPSIESLGGDCGRTTASTTYLCLSTLALLFQANQDNREPLQLGLAAFAF